MRLEKVAALVCGKVGRCLPMRAWCKFETTAGLPEKAGLAGLSQKANSEGRFTDDEGPEIHPAKNGFQSPEARQKRQENCEVNSAGRIRHSRFDIRPASLDIFQMLDLATASHAQFAPCVGQTFDLSAPGGPLTLAEARPLGTAFPGTARESFALTFHGTPALRLPQGIYRLENATLGAMECFLVQVAATANASQFEAIFN